MARGDTWVLIRWMIDGRWTTRYHVVEPGLAVGHSHDRMLCGLLRQPSFQETELLTSRYQHSRVPAFEVASGLTSRFESVRVVDPKVCGGCLHEVGRRLARAHDDFLDALAFAACEARLTKEEGWTG